MSINKFNPFAEIVESKKYSDARTLRTDFSQKMWDAYHIFAGKRYLGEGDNEAHVGLFDYGTLFLPFLLRWLLRQCLDGLNSNNFFVQLIGALGIIPAFLLYIVVSIPLFVLRIVVSLVLTLVVSPIIGITHLAASIFARDWRKDVLELENENYRNPGQTLRQHLDKCQITLEKLDVRLHPIYDSTDKAPNQPDNYSLGFWRRVEWPASRIVCEDCPNGDCGHNTTPFFSLKLYKDGEKTLKHPQLKSFFRLNVGKVVTNIEDSNNEKIKIILRTF